MGSFVKACKAFWAALTSGPAAEIPTVVSTAPAADVGKIAALEAKLAGVEGQLDGKFREGAVYTLALLQREGRLVDFLKEDIAAFDDAQVGAAVRQIHAGCAKTIEAHFQVRPVVASPEGEKLRLADDFDPAEVTLTGDTPDKPPYQGTLVHKGWRADAVELPRRAGKIKTDIVCPAEVSF